MASLSQKTVIGVAWNLAEQFAVRGITVVVTLLLAYFLSPEDFGLVAMMTVFISIATSLMDSGFRQALIRLPDAKQVDLNTAFYANILLGLVAYLLLFLAAPLISGFYDEARLTTLIRVAGLVVIINAFQVVQYACLSRALNFKVQFRAALPASLISAFVAIAMAYSGFGVWALIIQMLISAAMVAILLWLQNLWRPTLSWSVDSLKSMYRFGYKLFLSGLLDTGFKNMYVVVIAKLFTTSLAGLYFFADRIREVLIFQFVGVIQKVTYPALANIQNDTVSLKKGYRRIIKITAFLLFPFILFVAAFAELLFHFFLPEKWWPASIYLQLMCLAGLLVPIHAVNLNVLQVLGRSDLFLLLEVIKKIMAVAALIISFRFGVIGILLGQVIISFISWIPNGYFSKRLINYSLYEQLKDFSPPLLLASACAGMILLFQARLDVEHDIVLATIFILIVAVVYVLVAKSLKFKSYASTVELVSGFYSNKNK